MIFITKNKILRFRYKAAKVRKKFQHEEWRIENSMAIVGKKESGRLDNLKRVIKSKARSRFRFNKLIVFLKNFSCDCHI